MAINFPFGAIDTETIAAATTTAAITIDSAETIITTETMTGNCTLNLTVSSQVPAGAKLYLIFKSNATETFTFGTAIEAPVITGVAGKTQTQGFVYNGTNFYPMGAKIQVD
jgi:hypothetical protein